MEGRKGGREKEIKQEKLHQVEDADYSSLLRRHRRAERTSQVAGWWEAAWKGHRGSMCLTEDRAFSSFIQQMLFFPSLASKNRYVPCPMGAKVS